MLDIMLSLLDNGLTSRPATLPEHSCMCLLQTRRAASQAVFMGLGEAIKMG